MPQSSQRLRSDQSRASYQLPKVLKLEKAYVLRLIWNLRAQRHNKTHPEENDMKPKEGPSLPEELQEEEHNWIKESQKSLSDRFKKRWIEKVQPIQRFWWHLPSRCLSRQSLSVSYETRHPALLPREHWISLLITRQVHQCGHTAVAATVAKTRRRFWILIIKAHNIAKSVKFRCVFCREMQAMAESQVMAELPQCRLAPFTPPFYSRAFRVGNLNTAISSFSWQRGIKKNMRTQRWLLGQKRDECIIETLLESPVVVCLLFAAREIFKKV